MKIAGTYLIWDNKLLIHKRGKMANKKTAHTFGAPGGKVDPGEDFLTAALRELEEEAGLKLSRSGFKVLNKIRSHGPEARPDSVMYIRILSKKPLVSGPSDEKFKDEVEMDFDFASTGIKGESAGPDSGHYWADVNSLFKFLENNPEYSNNFLHDNILLVRKVLKTSKSRKASKA